MSRSASFHRLAEIELLEAVQYYAEIEAGLARRFLDAAEQARDEILRFPEAAPLVTSRIRRKTLGGFPYSFFYRLTEAEARILAVGHHRRRPFYWHGRR